jgi:hypothetical protein
MDQVLRHGTTQRNWIGRVLRDRTVQIGIAVWIVFSAAIPFLAHGVIPFDQPWAAAASYQARVMGEIIGPALAFIFIFVAWALTRRRARVDVATRAPECAIAMWETIGLLIYGAIVLIGGEFAGRLVGTHGIGLHVAGSMEGLSDTVLPREAVAWMIYNFIFYAVLPYWFFRRRGYSNEALCLHSSNPLNDAIVIGVVLAIGLAADLPHGMIWKLTAHQLTAGALYAFILSLFGTGLPIMIFLTSILVPRYKKLTGSTAGTAVLGGFTYASLHLTEYWTRYDSFGHGALSVIFIVLFFGGPGMVKSYLTQRTGNAWVHLWGYHAIWPHVTADTPVFVQIFGIK